MGTKAGSSFATFLLSVPIAAVALMAIFGVPQFTQVIASPDETLIIRDPYESGSRQRMRDDYERTSGDLYDGRDDPRFSRDRRDSDDLSYGRHGENFSELPQRQPHSSPVPSRRDTYEPRREPEHPFADWREERPNSQPSRFPDEADGRRTGSSSPVGDWPMRATHAVSEEDAPSSREIASSRERGEGGGRQFSWREASQRLAEIGIRDYHLERGASEHSFLFVCLFSPGNAPHVTHRFEAEADDPLVAVNQVLRQIDGWLQQRFAAERFPAGESL